MPSDAASPAEARRQIERMLAEPALSDRRTRAQAHYLLWEVCQICGDPAAALDHLAQAIALDPVQTRPRRAEAPPPERTVLALAAPGDFQANLPLAMLLDEPTLLHTLWIERPGATLPPLPPVDCVFVAMGEDSCRRALLLEADRVAGETGLPVLNSGAAIAGLSRDGVCAMLAGIEDCVVPEQNRVTAARLRHELPTFPFILRPESSHAGIGLARIDGQAGLDAYLEATAPAAALFAAPFIDYRDADGLYRKYRIAFVDRVPFPVHLAIHDDWAVWYYNARMELSAERRREEERFLRDPVAAMGPRAFAAVQALGRRIDLDYAGLDCAVLPDGRLLVFEVETAMLVHDRDPPDLFPGKAPAIARIVAAVNAMIDHRSGRMSTAA
ncbi:hypothetical protein NFI95_07410 [Acetobacteraceae bacterium KSS8]|uniref:ATP-grasp domain-containing protein n=1 Tax=Endosaccharibacter trunci TaxID=2812733 RepID=A0ABT1W5W5_9PROT|nr:hypothetical protein [Acetobacteraceae bacterium KSS8]